MGKGGQLVRSAGNWAQVLAKEGKYTLLRLPSGEVRQVLSGCMATVGQLGAIDHKNVKLGKAGRKRNMGWRPQVRGVAMSPRDHPHGGGEGRSPHRNARTQNTMGQAGTRIQDPPKQVNR